MRLLLDVMCGKLAVYLRMCGHDAAYALDRDVEADDCVLALARAEDRTLVTRDVELAARADGSILLRSRDVHEQLRALRDAGVALTPSETPERCGRCNARLVPVASDAETPAYAPDPAETPTWRCPACGQHFWRGSHWDDVRATLAAL
ncbi:MAG: Mut7-C RNAse domain-containing protein [Haloarculaceae archaeon]